MSRRLLLPLLGLLVGLVAPSVGYAQNGATDNDVNRVAKQLYCPVCPNTPLDVCETKACEDWRAQIRDQLASGWTDDQVIEYFVAQYGERVLAEPRRSGFTSFVWLLPALSVVLGLFVVWQVLKSWKAKPAASLTSLALTTPPPSPEALARVEKELKEIA